MGIVKYFEATTLGDAWYQILYKIMDQGRDYLIDKGSFEGRQRLGLSVIVEIKFPGKKPLAPIMPEGMDVSIPTTEEDINEYSTYLMTAVRQPHEHYTYGEDLHWLIDWVIDYYKKNGYGTNRCYMTVGRPETVFFYDQSVDYSDVIFVQERVSGKQPKPVLGRQITNQWNKDPGNKPSSQCLRGIDTWIDNEKLHFWAYFRSWDHWGGFPVNLGGIQLMKEHMAGEIGVQDGVLIASSKDLHLYDHGWKEAYKLYRNWERVDEFLNKSTEEKG
ncbi:MAG: thymidylate synthase [Patescibacteria group bacterium]